MKNESFGNILFLLLVLSWVTVGIQNGTCCTDLNAVCVSCAHNTTVESECSTYEPWLAGCPVRDDCNNHLTGNPCNNSQLCYDWTGAIDGVYECQCQAPYIGQTLSGFATCVLDPCLSANCSGSCTVEWAHGEAVAICISNDTCSTVSKDCNTCGCQNGTTVCTTKPCMEPPRETCSSDAECYGDTVCAGSFCTPPLYNCSDRSYSWSANKTEWCCTNSGLCSSDTPRFCDEGKWLVNGTCVNDGCCSATEVATCGACWLDMSIADYCLHYPYSRGCGLCNACGSYECLIEAADDGHLVGKCVVQNQNCTKNCTSGVCQRDLSGQCVNARSFCDSCPYGCNSDGQHVACATRDPWEKCPVARACFGVNPDNPNDRFCCRERQYCNTDWHRGGVDGVFGGVCVDHYDPCVGVKCLEGNVCTVIDGYPSCAEAPLPSIPCGPGMRPLDFLWVSNVTTSYVEHSCAPVYPSYPCASLCAEDESCYVTVQNNNRVANCLPDTTLTECNKVRLEEGLGLCSTCYFASNEGTRCGPVSAKDHCGDLKWPPVGVQSCNTHGDCKVGERCSGFTPTALCSSPSGMITAYLNSGFKSCEPLQFICNEVYKDTWTAEEKGYCCGKLEIGCDAYNCLLGDIDNWSQGKQIFCCRNTGVGCSNSFDCTSWAPLGEWSFEKRVYCCEEEDIACPAPQYRCVGDPSSWDKWEKEDCCLLEGKGCDAGQFDCGSPVLGDVGRQWCCENMQLRCERWLGFACDDGDREKWTAEERKWCCYNHAVGCESLGGYACFDGNVKAWPLVKQNWCCDTFGVACAGVYSTLECVGEGMMQFDDDACCRVHGIGCPVACSLPDSFLSEEQQMECCTMLGSHCSFGVPEPMGASLPGVTRVALLMQGNCLDVMTRPKVFTWQLRVTVAGVDYDLLEKFSEVVVRGVSCGGEVIDIDNAWQEDQDLYWKDSIERQVAALVAPLKRKSTPLSFATTAGFFLHSQDVLNVTLDFPTAYLDQFLYAVQEAESSQGVLSGGRRGTSLIMKDAEVSVIIELPTPDQTPPSEIFPPEDEIFAEEGGGGGVVLKVWEVSAGSFLLVICGVFFGVLGYKQLFAPQQKITIEQFQEMEKGGYADKGTRYQPPDIFDPSHSPYHEEHHTVSYSFGESANLHHTFTSIADEAATMTLRPPTQDSNPHPLKLENLKQLQQELATETSKGSVILSHTPAPFR